MKIVCQICQPGLGSHPDAESNDYSNAERKTDAAALAAAKNAIITQVASYQTSDFWELCNWRSPTADSKDRGLNTFYKLDSP